MASFKVRACCDVVHTKHDMMSYGVQSQACSEVSADADDVLHICDAVECKLPEEDWYASKQKQLKQSKPVAKL